MQIRVIQTQITTKLLPGLQLYYQVYYFALFMKPWFSGRWQKRYVFLVVLLIRGLNAFTNKTFFQPDEFYQCLEPAHYAAFGYGYITWEWRQQLRSAVAPLVYAAAYRVAAAVAGDTREVILVAPKVLGAVIAAVGEVHIYIFAKRYFKDDQMGKLAVVMSVLNPFNWHVITRSFSNSLEMVLTTVALAHWPWRGVNHRRVVACCGPAFLSCVIRPTNAMLWLCIGVAYLWRVRILASRLVAPLAAELVIVLISSAAIDFAFYRQWTFPVYNFLEFNVVRNLSVFYGTSPWHFHLFQSIPVLLTTYLPLWVYALYRYHGQFKDLLMATAVTVAGFSAIDHKEFRFLYPLQPLFLIVAAYTAREALVRLRWARRLAVVLVAVNMAIAYFLSQINERGTIDILDYVSDANNNVDSFGFLTPCHSTPWQSHLHNRQFEPSWFITCEPPLEVDPDTYRDESDLFLDDPVEFIRTNFPPSLLDLGDYKYLWPSHLVIFEPLEGEMDLVLLPLGYHKCHRLFNSYFHWDPRRSGDIIVYCVI